MGPKVHLQWVSRFRSGENERFYECAFDYIEAVLHAAPASAVLDAGCGTGAHSIRLARRGYHVVGIDLSDSALKLAQEHVLSSGLANRITLQRESLLGLSFEDEQFKYILCWGVLMHVAELEKAVAELCRVLRPGGFLVVSEINMFSLHAVCIRSLKRFWGRTAEKVNRTPAGLEYWDPGPGGMLLTRHTHMSYLIKMLQSHNLSLRVRVAGQFTEIYTRARSRSLKGMIHGFNHIWFKWVKIPYPALGNIVILQKEG